MDAPKSILVSLIIMLSLGMNVSSNDDQARIAAHLKNRADQPWTWVFYGDSITHGAAHTHGWRSFVEIFAERLRWELRRPLECVINSGNSGQTVKNLLDEKQYDWQVRRFHPAVVIVMIGMNDIVSGRTPEEFKNDLGRLVDRIREDGATVVLQTCNTIEKVQNPNTEYLRKYLTRYNELPRYMELVRAVAQEKDTLLVDNFAYWNENASDPATLSSWLGETIHPGALGHQKIAVQLLQVLGMYSPDSRCCSLSAGANGLPANKAQLGSYHDAFAKIKNWTVAYDAAEGLPGDAWKSTYAAEKLSLVESGGVRLLRLDNSASGSGEYSLLTLADPSALRGLGPVVLLELCGRFPESAEAASAPKKPNCFFLTLSSSCGGKTSEIILQFSPAALSGTLGQIPLPPVVGAVFTLQLALDTAAGRAEVWLDGKSLGTFPVRNLTDKAERMNFGDGSSGVGGAFELQRLRVAPAE